ncbi:hypothetical protein [Nocardia fluminea]
MVEEANVVGLLLARDDLGLDESVQLGQISGQIFGQIEIHCLT